jgi:hypothetical protein
VESYSFQASSIVNSQLYGKGADFKEFITSTGMEKKMAYLPRVDLIGVERNLIESLENSQAFYPEEMLKQPFGHGTKNYNFFESVHLLYDLEPFSNFSELRDPLTLITQKPNFG